MSVSHANRGIPSYQRFQCLICHSRFTRHENLKRHAALHSRSRDDAPLPCEICHATFSRPDLRHRHMKRKHLENDRRRTTERPHRDPAASTERSEEWSPQGHRVYPTSPTENQDGLHPQYPCNETELEMDSGIWQTSLRPTQHQPNYDYHTKSTDSATNGPISNVGERTELTTDPQRQQLSITERASISQIVQDVTDLEQNLLLGTPFHKPTHDQNTQLHPMPVPQPTTFDTDLDGFNFNQSTPDSLLFQDDWSPSALQIHRGCELFFAHVSHFVPFIHQATFDTTKTAPHLVLSILCLAYQYGNDPECGDDEGSGASLSTRCFHRARALLASDEGGTVGLKNNVTMVQSHLLLQICAMMYLCGDDSAYGLKMHSNMISLARSGGMMQPLSTESTVTEDLESLWREFIKVETHKRTLFAVHQIDALWYQFLSIPRSISHLEIKHDLPCPRDHWAASSSSEWAHRQLISRNSGPSVQYADAVRRFLSPDADLNSIPAFDPYGAINIAQFLISSAREISGWSTMTGILSMERFGALRSSLAALGPFICPQSERAKAIHTVSCEATWQTAMIELQMWSPSHTGGIVEASMDAVLTQSTYLAPSSEFLCEANIAKAIQPHVDWFLHYLDTTLVADSEAPWITLYAYKAFLIGWQLVRGKLPGAMQVVGIHEGDVDGALIWARNVFRRRQRWQLGKLILSCLDNLGN